MTTTEKINHVLRCPERVLGLLPTCSQFNVTHRDTTPFLCAADHCEDYANGYDDGLTELGFFLRWLAGYKRLDSFLFTGSRRYGTPKPDSDFDWVLRASQSTQAFLESKATEVCGKQATPDEDDYRPGRRTTIQSVARHHYDDLARLDVAVRFGPVNVLLVSASPQWDCWKEGTDQLVREAPVTRERAVQVFTENWAAREEAWAAEAAAQEEAMAEYEAAERPRRRRRGLGY